MNVIFGSGIVGLVAKTVLSGDWTIVPFGRSRFYSFNPPLADNFITRDAEIDGLMRDLGDASIQPHFYRRAYSYEGKLVDTPDKTVCEIWLEKIFGHSVPSQAPHYWAKRLVTPIYDMRTNKLYEQLQNRFLGSLKEEAAKGEVTEIGKHYFVQGGQRREFDHAVSTIPLSALLNLIGSSNGLALESLPVYYLHLRSKTIDLEGANQSFVVDKVLDFYKVTNIAKNHYMFYFLQDIEMPGAYLLPIIGAADIIDGTKMDDVIPAGEMPDLNWLDEYGIFCIGSHAQHDWCADVGSNFLRLVRYAQRGYKYAT